MGGKVYIHIFRSIIRGKRAKSKRERAKRQKGKEADQLISGERCPDMGAVVRAHCGVLGAGCQVEDFAVGGDRRVEDLVVKLMMCPFCIIKT